MEALKKKVKFHGMDKGQMLEFFEGSANLNKVLAYFVDEGFPQEKAKTPPILRCCTNGALSMSQQDVDKEWQSAFLDDDILETLPETVRAAIEEKGKAVKERKAEAKRDGAGTNAVKSIDLLAHDKLDGLQVRIMNLQSAVDKLVLESLGGGMKTKRAEEEKELEEEPPKKKAKK
jgi:hypothetical protein